MSKPSKTYIINEQIMDLQHFPCLSDKALSSDAQVYLKSAFERIWLEGSVHALNDLLKNDDDERNV